MAHDVGKNDVRLYQGQANPKDIVLRDLEATAAATGTTIYLRTLDANPKDIVVRDTTAFDSSGPATIVSVGIASSEAFGQPTITPAVSSHDIISAGIPTIEAIGTPSISVTVSAAGITSSEVLGSPSVATNVASAGIASGEALGIPNISATVLSSGIASEEAFGLPVVSLVGGAWTIESVGIPSEEAFGNPTIGEISYSQEVELNLIDLKPRPKPQHQEIAELAEKLEQVEELEEQKVELETEIRAARKKKNVAKIKTQEYDELKTYIFLLSIELNALTVDLSGLQEQIRAMQAIENRLEWQQSINEQNMLELDMAFVMAMMAEA